MGSLLGGGSLSGGGGRQSQYLQDNQLYFPYLQNILTHAVQGIVPIRQLDKVSIRAPNAGSREKTPTSHFLHSRRRISSGPFGRRRQCDLYYEHRTCNGPAYRVVEIDAWELISSR